jgi:PIN domain nuclease of toxin-antitoxin system
MIGRRRGDRAGYACIGIAGSGRPVAQQKSAHRDRARGDGALVASAISAWEIAMRVRRERLALTMDVDAWLGTVAQIAGMRFVPSMPTSPQDPPSFPARSARIRPTG